MELEFGKDYCPRYFQWKISSALKRQQMGFGYWAVKATQQVAAASLTSATCAFCDPLTGPSFGTPFLDPALGSCFYTPLWDPVCGPSFGTLYPIPFLGMKLLHIAQASPGPILALRFSQLFLQWLISLNVRVGTRFNPILTFFHGVFTWVPVWIAQYSCWTMTETENKLSLYKLSWNFTVMQMWDSGKDMRGHNLMAMVMVGLAMRDGGKTM